MLKVLSNMNLNLKNKSQLTNMIFYAFETCNIDRAVPFCKSAYKLSNISGNYIKDITSSQCQKCLEDYCF